MRLRYGLGGVLLLCIGLGLIWGTLETFVAVRGWPVAPIGIGTLCLFFGGLGIGYGGGRADMEWSDYVKRLNPKDRPHG